MANERIATYKSLWSLLGTTVTGVARAHTYSKSLTGYVNSSGEGIQVSDTRTDNRVVKLSKCSKTSTTTTLTDEDVTLTMTGTYNASTKKFVYINFAFTIDGTNTVAPTNVTVTWGDGSTVTILKGYGSVADSTKAPSAGYYNGQWYGVDEDAQLPTTIPYFNRSVVESTQDSTYNYNFTISRSQTVYSEQNIQVSLTGVWDDVNKKFTRIESVFTKVATDGITSTITAPVDTTITWKTGDTFTIQSGYGSSTNSDGTPNGGYADGTYYGASGIIPNTTTSFKGASVANIIVGNIHYNFTISSVNVSYIYPITATGTITPNLNDVSGSLTGIISFNYALPCTTTITCNIQGKVGGTTKTSNTISLSVIPGTTSIDCSTAAWTCLNTIKTGSFNVSSGTISLSIINFEISQSNDNVSITNSVSRATNSVTISTTTTTELNGQFSNALIYNSSSSNFDWALINNSSYEDIVTCTDTNIKTILVTCNVIAFNAIGEDLGVIDSFTIKYTRSSSGWCYDSSTFTPTEHTGGYSGISYTQPSNMLVTGINIVSIITLDSSGNVYNTGIQNNIENYSYIPNGFVSPFEIATPVDLYSPKTYNGTMSVVIKSKTTNPDISFEISLSDLGTKTGYKGMVFGILQEVLSLNNYIDVSDEIVDGHWTWGGSKWSNIPSPDFIVSSITFSNPDIHFTNYFVGAPEFTNIPDAWDEWYYVTKGTTHSAGLSDTNQWPTFSPAFISSWPYEGTVDPTNIKSRMNTSGIMPNIDPYNTNGYNLWDTSNSRTNLITLFICEEPVINIAIQNSIVITEDFEDPYKLTFTLDESLATFDTETLKFSVENIFPLWDFDPDTNIVEFDTQNKYPIRTTLDSSMLGQYSNELEYRWGIKLNDNFNGHPNGNNEDYETDEIISDLTTDPCMFNGLTTEVYGTKDDNSSIKVRVSGSTIVNGPTISYI